MLDPTEMDKEALNQRASAEKTTLVVYHMISVMELILSDPSLLITASDRIQSDINMLSQDQHSDDIPPEVFLAQDFLNKMHHDYTRRIN